MATTETIKVLDPQGVQDLAQALFGKTELQINARIVSELNDSVTSTQTPSAVLVKSLIEALQAKDSELSTKIDQVQSNVEDSISSDLETLEGRVDTAESNISDLQTKSNTLTSNVSSLTSGLASANSALSDLQTKVAGLTHLTIETVVGSIDTVSDPKTDVLYFQKDDEADQTWEMFVWHEHEDEDESHWINVGNTAVDLVNYWRKDDIDGLKEALGWVDVESMSSEQISSAVNSAFTAAFPN